MYTNYTLIISIYKKITYSEVNKSIKSIKNQTHLPSQIILIFDGFYPYDLKNYVINFFRTFIKKNDLLIIQNASNKGITYSYNFAIKNSKHNLIGIQDSDDESLPNRFKLQTEYFLKRKNLSVLGGFISEQYGKKKFTKKMPLTAAAIKNLIYFKNPINHPTVMFRKDHLLSFGLYSECKRMEDYYLWINLISKGLLIENLPVILCKSYIDRSFIKRRSTNTILLSELKIQLLLLRKFKVYLILFIFVAPLKIFYHLMLGDIKIWMRFFINYFFSLKLLNK